MIKNDLQYRNTKAHADKFSKTLAEISSSPVPPNVHPLLWQAQIKAMESQMKELQAEIEEYKNLQEGYKPVLVAENFDELPELLIKARIAQGITQNQLAERLGLKEQQIQRYEATNYCSASFTRLQEVIKALGVSLKNEAIIPIPQLTRTAFIDKIKRLGVNFEFVKNRILPMDLTDILEKGADSVIESSVIARSASILSKVFWISPDTLLNSESGNQVIDKCPVRYKKSKNSNENTVSYYTMYAYTLCLTLFECTKDIDVKPIPEGYSEIYKAICKDYGKVSFKNSLRYVWGLGIPVLPLNDSAAFHGAYFKINKRSVIVLKQNVQSEARWTFDLFHELRHAFQNQNDDELMIIEGDIEHTFDVNEEEIDANEFAGNMVLNGKAAELAEKSLSKAKGNLRLLKNAVIEVAKENHVEAAYLANYIAYRLMDEQKQNWWGTANNLQGEKTQPSIIATDILLEHVNLNRTKGLERDIFLKAITNIN